MAVRITGMEKVLDNLRRLDKDFNRKIVKPAVNKGLEPIKRQAQQNCKHESLRKLIRKSAFINRKKQVQGKVFLGQSKDRTIKLEGRDVGFEAVGMILEFGSVKRNISPQPFMRTARDQAKGRALAIMETEIRKSIGKI